MQNLKTNVISNVTKEVNYLKKEKKTPYVRDDKNKKQNKS